MEGAIVVYGLFLWVVFNNIIFDKSLSQKYIVWDFSQAASLTGTAMRISAAQQCHLWWSDTKGLQMALIPHWKTVTSSSCVLKTLKIMICLVSVAQFTSAGRGHVRPVWGQKKKQISLDCHIAYIIKYTINY